LERGICLACENKSLRAQAQRQYAKADLFREALHEWLHEIEASEADSENEHAGCLCNAASRIRAVVKEGA
jgi:hypothetical protein